MADKEIDSKNVIETIKQIYNAINSDDVSTYIGFFDENVERFETFGGRFHGLHELKLNFSTGRDSWAEGRCQPENFILIEDKVIVFVHVKVKLKTNNQWIDGKVTDVFTFKNSKVVQFYSFDKRDEALRWAGLI